VEVFVIVWALSDETANKRFDPNTDWYSPLAFDFVDHRCAPQSPWRPHLIRCVESTM
jgi:hypothetical protein